MDQHPLPRFALPGDWSEPWCTLALSAPTAIPANCSMVPGAIEKPTQQSALSRNPILDRTLKRVSVDACSWLELQRAPVGDDAVTRLVSDCRIGVARARTHTHAHARAHARLHGTPARTHTAGRARARSRPFMHAWLGLQRAPVGDDAVTRLVSDCRVGVARARARTRHCTARTRARTLPTARSRVGRHAAHGSRHARRASGVDCPTK
jgi:hypothetical protein